MHQNETTVKLLKWYILGLLIVTIYVTMWVVEVTKINLSNNDVYSNFFPKEGTTIYSGTLLSTS